jgi:hypothetical protein
MHYSRSGRPSGVGMPFRSEDGNRSHWGGVSLVAQDGRPLLPQPQRLSPAPNTLDAQGPIRHSQYRSIGDGVLR